MANLVITSVRPVRYDQADAHTLAASEAITKGKYARLDGTTGKFALGNATTAPEVGRGGGIALTTAASGEPTTVLRRGLVDVEDALSAMSYGDPVYLSDTDGTFATTAGTVSTIVGYVDSGSAETPYSKLLRLTLD